VLAASPLIPQGALICAWEDEESPLQSRASTDIWVAFRPSPIVQLN
jgi:hypothetical protein